SLVSCAFVSHGRLCPRRRPGPCSAPSTRRCPRLGGQLRELRIDHAAGRSALCLGGRPEEGKVLAGEDEEFAARVKDAGIDTATVVVPEGQHSYVYGVGRVPEADAAIAQIGAWVRAKTTI
ncbi:hypothetical protein ABZT42_55720, partial [Streptomyces mirabilis]